MAVYKKTLTVFINEIYILGYYQMTSGVLTVSH